MVGTDVDLLKHPVVSAAVGTAAVAVGAAGIGIPRGGEGAGFRAVDAARRRRSVRAGRPLADPRAPINSRLWSPR